MGVRLRFTLLYGVLFLLSGAGLLALTAAFSVKSTTHVGGGAPPPLPPQEQIAKLQEQLDSATAAQVRQIVVGATVALGVMVLVSLVLGRAAAGRVLRPLRRITAATRRISADNLNSRLAVDGPPDEVKALADTIDDLLGRLEEAFAAQRRFVADASHELRTPLATIRATVDVAEAKPAPSAELMRLSARIRAELDQLESLLEGLLVLARAQHGALEGRKPVLMTSLLPASVSYQGTDFVTVGNPVLLARMVGNVLDNAVRHGAPGSRPVMTLAPGTLVVENDGPVLEPAQVATLGRPFQRLGADRTRSTPGTGLGTAIASSIAAAHGGSVRFRARPEGGLRVEIRLPSGEQGSSAAAREVRAGVNLR